MGKSLVEIARELKDSPRRVQLVYAFNGVGKTRLSRAFKELIVPKHGDNLSEIEQETRAKIIYYNAFTEDLFYWDNDLTEDRARKLKIHPNRFTNWIFEEEGKEISIISLFQHYTNDRLTPRFSANHDEVEFSLERGDENRVEHIKISRGEESCFVWCIFYSLLKEVVETLNTEEENRATSQFDDLKYVFIDDPVSSLDENHLIELAVNIADLINSSPSDLKFVVTTHNPLFYNVLYNELNLKKKNKKESPCAYLLDKSEDGSFELVFKPGDSNQSFSYHLFLKHTIEEAVESGNIQKYHFTLLRNLYEKTANFLGYPNWVDLLPGREDDRRSYYNRIIQFTSHSTLSNEVVAEPTHIEKNVVKYLLEELVKNRYWNGGKEELR